MNWWQNTGRIPPRSKLSFPAKDYRSLGEGLLTGTEITSKSCTTNNTYQHRWRLMQIGNPELTAQIASSWMGTRESFRKLSCSDPIPGRLSFLRMWPWSSSIVHAWIGEAWMRNWVSFRDFLLFFSLNHLACKMECFDSLYNSLYLSKLLSKMGYFITE